MDGSREIEKAVVMDAINELVNKYKMTCVTIAEAIGGAPQNVRWWRNGKGCPRPHFRIQLFLLLESKQKNG